MQQSLSCSLSSNCIGSMYHSAEQSLGESLTSGYRSIKSVSSAITSSISNWVYPSDVKARPSQDVEESLSDRNIYSWVQVGKSGKFIPTGIPAEELAIPTDQNRFEITTEYLTDSIKGLTSSVTSLFTDHAEDNLGTDSISSHLSLMNATSELSLDEDNQTRPYTSWWPQDIARTYISNMTYQQKETWIHRIHNMEFALGKAISKQVLFNGYKFFCKACYFLARSQMPEAMNDAFAMLDRERQLNELYDPLY